MRVNRKELLKRLEAVSSGLAKNDVVEQGRCFVFGAGKVATFNDEVAVRTDSPLEVEGAVQAEPLLALLRKMPEDELDVEVSEEGLMVKGRGCRSSVRMEAEVLLPVDGVEDPGEWAKMPDDLLDALRVCAACCSSNDSHFVLACVHVAGKYVEASDDKQIVRWPIETGIVEDVLLRRDSVVEIAAAGPTEWSETENWLHFRSPSGLTMSCRRYVQNYPDVGRILKEEGGCRAEFPKGIDDMLDKALIFSCENPAGNFVLVSLSPGRLKLKGEGASGWYEERRKVAYDGEPLAFFVEPKLLLEISRKADECLVGDGKIRVNAGKFTYLACTSAVEE